MYTYNNNNMRKTLYIIEKSLIYLHTQLRRTRAHTHILYTYIVFIIVYYIGGCGIYQLVFPRQLARSVRSAL